MSSIKLTIFVVGPPRSGKTALCNYLAELSESLNSSQYHPTEGVRILEFERKIVLDSKKTNSKSKETIVSVELWDCSGDPKFYPCWPAVANTAHGAVILFSPDSKQEKEVETWYNFFSFMKDSQIAVFAHKMMSPSQKGAKMKLAGKLSKLNVTSTTLDEQTKAEFDTVICNAYQAYTENREREEQKNGRQQHHAPRVNIGGLHETGIQENDPTNSVALDRVYDMVQLQWDFVQKR
ncbi:uncharacterized protein BJ171DRAFT_612770 [Polychytrium aggregatum]|uniref:uncharacterized protein n=1 Tax=Polychytrium aggregatum TaxID=110093 RepID=UPI0022FE3004|nr:uncharacterized protein BJ171DRAFT_612770 [Polychytrium aggregatum]KAI9206187.1 hypothetical protein BJ171DRAFT_612770 [Polychytrium aggregatum]